MTQVADYYNKIAKDYYKQYSKDVDEYPANKIRLEIIIRRLRKLGVSSVYEIGVGEGTPLLQIAKETGITVDGCDISMEMLALAKQKIPSVHYGDANKRIDLTGQPYSAVIAAGVLPHIENERNLIDNIRSLLRYNGTALVEFRNSIFSLFSFNRHTRKFLIKELLAPVSTKLTDLVNLWEPIVRFEKNDEPEREFDKIARFHNPFELQKLFEANGFDVRGFHWYHYHAAPPIFDDDFNGKRFREESLKLEGSGDWRGMFLCSAGIIEAVKK